MALLITCKRGYQMTFLLVCFIFVIGNTVAQNAWVVKDEGCRTPDRDVGNCILIKDCKPITDLLMNSPQPLSFELVEKLRSYTCGFQGKKVMVCCPPKPIEIGVKSQPEAPDVSNHKNFNLLPFNCGRVDPDDKIQNGEDAGLKEFPWMALLSYKTSAGPAFKCGGSIINDRYILTAAHCITNLKENLLGVRIGEHTVPTKEDCQEIRKGIKVCLPPVQDLRIEEIIPHPQYSVQQFSNDIGLLRVAKMNLNVDNAKPVCMPTDTMRNFSLDNLMTTVTGWGFDGKVKNSPVLQKVELPIISLESCKETYKKNAPITVKQICAGGRDQKDSCPGDSGGPMQRVSYHNNDPRYVQHGVVSFGPKICGINGLPGVYTRVAYYLDWVLDNMKT